MLSKDRVIVALDGMSEQQSLALAQEVKGFVWGFKVNDLLLQSGISIVEKLSKLGRVFADPKLCDIPNTVGNSVRRLAEAGADLITVHTSAGRTALERACKERGEARILAITVLTSLDELDTNYLYKRNPVNAVLSMANFAKDAGVQGIVCSPIELSTLKEKGGFESLLKVTPGIRPSWYGVEDDQKRISTPHEAINNGASYLVIGRPITKSENPVDAAKKISEELARQ
jgi:orotidine-5'-phosphate decarboxylase